MTRLISKGVIKLFFFFGTFFIIRMLFGLVNGNFDWSLVETIKLFKSSFSNLQEAFTQYYAEQFAAASNGDILTTLRAIEKMLIGVPYFLFVLIGDLVSFVGGMLGI